MCGIWGTLAVGIFSADHTVMTQLIGVMADGVFTFLGALAIFSGLKATMGVRVSKDEEVVGLDVGEYGMEAYGGFQMVSPGLGSRQIQSSAEAGPVVAAKTAVKLGH